MTTQEKIRDIEKRILEVKKFSPQDLNVPGNLRLAMKWPHLLSDHARTYLEMQLRIAVG